MGCRVLSTAKKRKEKKEDLIANNQLKLYPKKIQFHQICNKRSRKTWIKMQKILTGRPKMTTFFPWNYEIKENKSQLIKTLKNWYFTYLISQLISQPWKCLLMELLRILKKHLRPRSGIFGGKRRVQRRLCQSRLQP